jgi:uncharacterized protein
VLSRRQLIQTAAVVAGGTFGLSGYAFAEPRQLIVKRYRITPQQWPTGLRLRVALLADLHVCEPWMNVERIHRIVEHTNRLAPDCVMLLGDYMPGRRMLRFARPIPANDWAAALGKLQAPLGVHAVLGNHDWWDDPEAQRLRDGPTLAGRALQNAGIAVYENDAVRFEKNGQPFWIAGLGDQGALLPDARHSWHQGRDDLPTTLRRITDQAPVILMAHEPDIFPRVPGRVALTVSGHTHGGQVHMPGVERFFTSPYANRYRYGHIVENNQHLIVSSGLGCSAVPVRLGVPPEIVVVELGNWSPAALS